MPSAFQYRMAARLLHQGGILAYPTEAVYGLGCHPLDPQAVSRLLTLKQRPLNKGLILVAANWEQLQPFVGPLEAALLTPVLGSWPGPHTWLLPAAPDLPVWINGGGDRLAVRVTAHPPARKLCQHFGGPLVSTSANLSGRPPARTPLQVRLRCPGTDRILCGPTGGLDKPTLIRDALSGKVIRA